MWRCVKKLKIKHSQTDIIESCKLIFFCVWIEMVTHVDNITNVKLPPVDTLTVLCTYISRNILWFGFGFFSSSFFFLLSFFFFPLCVYMYRWGHFIIYFTGLSERSLESILIVAHGFPAAQKYIYLWLAKWH